MPVKRRRLLAAVRERMHSDSVTREAELTTVEDPAADAVPPPPSPRQPPPVNPQLEQLTAEARYHRDRFDLYRARVISGSSRATSPARLRELERVATSAEARLAHARRGDA